MRACLLAIVLLCGAGFLSPADAAELPETPVERAAPGSPDSRAPEDWIPVAGVVCYVVLPVLVVLAGLAFYVQWVRSHDAAGPALLPSRAAPLRPAAPRGVVLLRF